MLSVRRATALAKAKKDAEKISIHARSGIDVEDGFLGGTAFCDPAGVEHIGHLIFLHDSGQIPAVAVITQQADPAELCCKVHLLR